MLLLLFSGKKKEEEMGVLKAKKGRRRRRRIALSFFSHGGEGSDAKNVETKMRRKGPARGDGRASVKGGKGKHKRGSNRRGESRFQ